MLEWAAISFSRGSSRLRDWTHVSCIGSCRFFITESHRGSPCSSFNRVKIISSTNKIYQKEKAVRSSCIPCTWRARMNDWLPHPLPCCGTSPTDPGFSPWRLCHLIWGKGTLLMRLLCSIQEALTVITSVTTEVEVMGPPRQRPEWSLWQTGEGATSQGKWQLPEARMTRERLSPHSPRKTQTPQPQPAETDLRHIF